MTRVYNFDPYADQIALIATYRIRQLWPISRPPGRRWCRQCCDHTGDGHPSRARVRRGNSLNANDFRVRAHPVTEIAAAMPIGDDDPYADERHPSTTPARSREIRPATRHSHFSLSSTNLRLRATSRHPFRQHRELITGTVSTSRSPTWTHISPRRTASISAHGLNILATKPRSQPPAPMCLDMIGKPTPSVKASHA